MKTAIFNFLVLQVVIWTFVFSADISGTSQEVSYASIFDTWEVVKLVDKNDPGIVLHYPSFHKLTLNIDGTYIRLKNNKILEEGKWFLNKSNSTLTLINALEVKKYEIIQLPSDNSKSFIIKEDVNADNSKIGVKYELIRS